MKKVLKFVLVFIAFLIVLIILDTIQAIVFNNSPIFKITEGKKDVVFRWEKYFPYVESKSKEQPYFYGKVIESSIQYIIVEPNEGEDIRKSSDKISISLEDNNEIIYPVGTNLKITYTGEIMESYPAQIKVTNIEITDDI